VFAGVFEVPAALLNWFYQLTSSYALAISLIAVVIMVATAPLVLKSTKGMLEMQRLAPEMRRLQAEHRNDRQKLNEEMMKLYQEHKVNPMASCLPLVAQMPVFIIMFRVLIGLTYRPGGKVEPVAHAVLAAARQDTSALGFVPRYLSTDAELFRSLVGRQEMRSFGIDLAVSPAQALGDSLGRGLIYALLVVVLGGLYFLQQRMVAARAAISPTMSPAQQKLMQYLPVVFAVFQIFFLAGLVIYYIAQAILRIALQAYITRRFYGHEESLGRQAQRASEKARELAAKDGGGTGLFAQARKPADTKAAPTKGAAAKGAPAKRGTPGTTSRPASGRVTPPKNRPTPSARPGSVGSKASGRPAPQRPTGKPNRPKKRT
jgi:YidC/Oxa1 family membrane protein insertase